MRPGHLSVSAARLHQLHSSQVEESSARTVYFLSIEEDRCQVFVFSQICWHCSFVQQHLVIVRDIWVSDLAIWEVVHWAIVEQLVAE